MEEFISEAKILESIEHGEWLIENTNEKFTEVSIDVKDLKLFHENYYGKSSDSNINGGKREQQSDLQYITIKTKMNKIDWKYMQHNNPSDNK